MDVKIDTSQLKVLEDFFEGLSSVDQTKIFMASFRRAARPLIARAKANTPIMKNVSAGRTERTTSAEPGALRNSIGAIEMPQNISILVGAKMGVSIGRKLQYLGRWVEEGTKPRYRKQSRKIKRGYFRGQYKGVKGGTGYTGVMPSSDFFQRAWNAESEGMYGVMEKAWYEEIDKFIIKANRRAKK